MQNMNDVFAKIEWGCVHMNWNSQSSLYRFTAQVRMDQLKWWELNALWKGYGVLEPLRVIFDKPTLIVKVVLIFNFFVFPQKW